MGLVTGLIAQGAASTQSLTSQATTLEVGFGGLAVAVIGIIFIGRMLTKGHRAPSGEALAAMVGLFIAVVVLIGYVAGGGFEQWYQWGKAQAHGGTAQSSGQG